MRFWPGSKKLDWYLGWPAFIRTYVFGQKLVKFRKPLSFVFPFVKMFATLCHYIVLSKSIPYISCSIFVYFFFSAKKSNIRRVIYSLPSKVKFYLFESLFLSSFSKSSSRTYSQQCKHKAARSFHFVSLCIAIKRISLVLWSREKTTRSERRREGKEIRKEILFYGETRLIGVRCFFTVDTCPFIIRGFNTRFFPPPP